MIIDTDKLIDWAKKQVIQRTGPPRAYAGPYPDRSGPTCREMNAVARIADAIDGGVAS